MCYHYTALPSELACPSVCLSVSTQTEPCTALLVSVVPARLLAERRQLRVVCDYHITVFYITTSIELSRAKAEPSKFTVNVGINRRRISEFHGKFQGLSCVLYCIFDFDSVHSEALKLLSTELKTNRHNTLRENMRIHQ